MGRMTRVRLRVLLERLYQARNRPENIGPDPLGFVRAFSDPADVEVAGVVASALAYGRVAQIHATLRRVFAIMEHPAAYVARPRARIAADFEGFRHRFNDGRDLTELLVALGRVRDLHGSLLAAFARCDVPGADTLVPALAGFVSEVVRLADREPTFLLARPQRGGACKRWHLFLRWMVRADSVDPGPWRELGSRRLLVPLDVHLFRVGRRLAFTTRSSASLRASLEITAGFRALAPEDPVRYDFSIARAAMDGDLAAFGLASEDHRVRRKTP
jgi:uncharacterized protein (TIGR02757 family)